MVIKTPETGRIFEVAINYGDKIRFSIDFRIINKEYAHLTKKEHISAGNKPYFAEII